MLPTLADPIMAWGDIGPLRITPATFRGDVRGMDPLTIGNDTLRGANRRRRLVPRWFRIVIHVPGDAADDISTGPAAGIRT